MRLFLIVRLYLPQEAGKQILNQFILADGGGADEAPASVVPAGLYKVSFPDAEAAEDLTEEIVGGEFTGDFGERMLRFTQVLGEEFAGTMTL
ncbi:hypothetical protein C8E00_104366 [Chromohalobacter marismortui]|uniref:Uncharacterized protein n=1 Tax=Chromohalobacter marismortui TaxID=42055 RepID=A0A4R7NMW9_9GAMM|nr:hypothetical protein C8E00_104366 [Chromohalobacter marismortui]